MAPIKNKKRPSYAVIDLDDDEVEETARGGRGGKKAVRGNESWNSWQEMARMQEGDRVRQYMTTFQEKIAATQKKTIQSLQKAEEDRIAKQTEFLDKLKKICGEAHLDSAGAKPPLQATGNAILDILQTMLKRFEQTKEELRGQCHCMDGLSGHIGHSGQAPGLAPQAAWDKDHAEAHKLLLYGRAYGESLVHEVIVPRGGGGKTSAAVTPTVVTTAMTATVTPSPVALPDHVFLDRTGQKAIGLFPRSRAAVVSGQTWGETAQKQIHVLEGLVDTLPSGRKGEAALGSGAKSVSFANC